MTTPFASLAGVLVIDLSRAVGQLAAQVARRSGAARVIAVARGGAALKRLPARAGVLAARQVRHTARFDRGGGLTRMTQLAEPAP